MSILHKGGVKIFRDNVHDYIHVPKTFVNHLIDTPLFQRLRFIEQTGMRMLYPAARHDRFIHSLGVFHLGTQAFEKFKNNAKKYHQLTVGDLFWDHHEVLFAIACILHDIGHAPFSHALEFLFSTEIRASDTDDPRENNAQKILKKNIQEELASLFSDERRFFKDVSKAGADHEIVGAILVKKEYAAAIEQIMTDLDFSISENAMEDYLEFIVRAIIGYLYTPDTYPHRSEIQEMGLRNCLISLLNSNFLDVDSLDYIIRDAVMSGINSRSLDINRLFNSLTPVLITKISNKQAHFTLTLNNKILPGTSGSHFDRGDPFTIGNISIDAYIAGGPVEITNFKGKLSGVVDCRGTGDILLEIPEESVSKIPNYHIIIDGNDSNKRIGTLALGRFDIFCSLGNDNPLTLECPRVLTLGEDFEGRVVGTADKMSIKERDITLKGSITACCDSLFVGNINDKPENAEIEYQLGFHKSAISVLESILFARNYEYEWIYTHHTVAYYSNYLIPELLGACLKAKTGSFEKFKRVIYELTSTSFLSQDSYNNFSTNQREDDADNEDITNILLDLRFFMPNDYDLVHLFKSFFCRQIDPDKDAQVKCQELATEFFTRRYKKCVWKSFAEYRHFFATFSHAELHDIYQYLRKNLALGGKYGYFDEKAEAELKKIGLNDVIWVSGNTKLKSNLSQALIHFGDSVTTFKSVAEHKAPAEKSYDDFFYLFYKENDIYNSHLFDSQNREERKEEIKKREIEQRTSLLKFFHEIQSI